MVSTLEKLDEHLDDLMKIPDDDQDLKALVEDIKYCEKIVKLEA